MRAVRALPPMPPAPRIADLGCGPGRQTLVLAREFRTDVLALDLHQPFLDQLERAAAAAGLAQFVKARRCAMEDLDLPRNSLDLVWSEGALYTAGVARMLRLLHPALRPGGAAAFSEAAWLTENPPPEVSEFWSCYSDMKSVEGNLARIRETGLVPTGHFALPSEDWTAGYYGPLEQRIAELRAEAPDDAGLAAEIAETEREIDMFRRYGGSYGYVFYLASKPR